VPEVPRGGTASPPVESSGRGDPQTAEWRRTPGRSEGMAPRSAELCPTGGLSELERQPDSPLDPHRLGERGTPEESGATRR